MANKIDILEIPGRGTGGQYVLRCDRCMRLFTHTLRDCGVHVTCPCGFRELIETVMARRTDLEV
jgi:hypothetical protein